MQKLTKFLFFCTILIITGFENQGIRAQVMVSATGKPSSLVICYGDGTFSLQIANTSGGTMSGAILTLDLPPGVKYIPGTITGATELNISNLNQPVFSLPDILNNTAHDVSYNAGLYCGYTNTENFIYIVTYNSVNYTGFETPLQNYYYPEPVITNITNASATIPVNQTITRDITIQQQGINSTTDTLWIFDEHSSSIQVLSVNIGTLHPYVGPGPVYVDTIIITGPDLPGGNGLFDAGESIVVSEIVKLVGCTNGQSTIKASWGCSNQICNYYAAFPTVSPAAGTTSIAIAFTNNNKSWGFIDNSGWVEFSVTNNGTGAGTAFDLTILAGFSSGGSTYYPNGNWINKIDSFSVSGNYLPASYNYGAGATNGQYAFFTRFQYTFDPDGPGYGLEDADSDGYYDDLPPGKSTIVKAHTYYSWAQALSTIPTGNTCGSGWTNSAWQGFRYGHDYKNQCNIASGVNWIPNSSLTLFHTYDTRSVQLSIPPDLYNGVTVWFEHLTNTSTSVSSQGCPNDSVLYKLVLPQGVTIAPGVATFKNVSMGIPLIVGNTVYYFLDRTRILSGGLFRVPLVANCALNPPPTGIVSAELKFWCDNMAYPDRYFTYWCGNSPIFGIQCPDPLCTDPSISFLKITRKTLGWTDYHLTARVSPSAPGLRLDNAMSKDTIKIEAGGSLKGPADSLYFRIKHDALPGGWGNQLFFDYIADTLFFIDAETQTTYTCTGLSPQISNGTTSSLTTYFGNLFLPGNCLAGITLTSGDSLYYVIYGKVKNVAVTEWRTVPAFRAYFYWKDTGTEKYCNSKGTAFNVLGSNYPGVVTTFYQQIVLQGCSTFLYEGLYYRSLESCGGDIAFPNEIRPFIVLDTISFTLPEGFVYQPGSSVHRYNQDNTSSLASEAIPDPLITVSAAGTKLTYIRNSLWSYSDYYDCSNDREQINFSATPSCKANDNFSYQMYARGRYQFMADGAGISNTSSSAKSITYTPPLMNLTSLITTAEGKQDTVLWKVRVCNSRAFVSPVNWMGFESASAGIQIVGVTDITNPGTPVPIPFSSYGPGKTWVQLGTFAANLCRFYEIRAIYTSCYYDSILVRHGYNCAGYPYNPELGYPPSGYQCSENSAYLYLDPKDVSLNLSVSSPVNPVGLCDTLLYEVQVTNSQPSNAYNLKLTVALPPGAMIVSGLSEIKYPYTTGTFVPVSDPVNFPAGSNKWLYDISADTNGVVLLKGVDSIPKNGYLLRFSLLTDCDFISGKSLKITASASNACGFEKNRTSLTQPILISGLPTNINLYVLNSLSGDGFHTCNINTTVQVKVINLGPASVSSIEKLSITIDDAFDYVVNSLVGIHNGPSGLINNTVTGGIRYLYFGIEPNLPVNDSIVFLFQLHDVDPGSLECDTIPMETSTLLVGKVHCPSIPGDSCIIQSITASIITEKPVLKDHVAFGHYTASSVPWGTAGETAAISFAIKNTGADTLRSTNLEVVFVYDANNNGLPDETGVDSLHSYSVNVNGLLPGDSISGSTVFNVPANKVCRILSALRLNENDCICNDEVIPVSNIHLINAGPDTGVCQQTAVQIGTPAINGYAYFWVPSSFLNSYTISGPTFFYDNFLNQSLTLTYTLITTRPGDCLNRDTVLITVLPAPIANAGIDTIICSGTAYYIAGSNVQNYSSVLWTTSGSGSFNDPSLVHSTYTPGQNDISAGIVNLTLTAQGLCGSHSDQMTLLIQQHATASAGHDTAICQYGTYTLLDASSTNNTGIVWTTLGDGSFNDTTIIHPTYTPGTGDTTNGNVNLVLTATGIYPCPVISDTILLTLTPPPSVTNTLLAAAICSNDTTHIMLSANQSGTTFSWTATLALGTVTGFGPGTGNTISQVLINPTSNNGIVTYSVTPDHYGCLGQPKDFSVTVKPLPSITNNPTSSGICPGNTTNIILQSSLPGSSFSWTASGSSPAVTGYSAGFGPVISQTLFNSNMNNEVVTYHITPFANGCTGMVTDYMMTVYPVPDVYFNPPVQTICGGTNSTIQLFSHVTGASFSWTAAGSSMNVSGYTPGSGNSIIQILNNTGYQVESVTYHVTPLANGCIGIPGNAVVTVNPLPPVTFIACPDVITTINAQPFKLKGGSPPGGIYSGAGVNPATGIFSPSIAGTGLHSLVYSCTNQYSCTKQGVLPITVLTPQPFNCGDPLTDVRDGKTYPTVLIGIQCWMAANLNFGSVIPSSLAQRDNCLAEKYCYIDNPLNCSTYGGYYQWDEIMRFEEIQEIQGLCPPGWHIPSETDWNILFAYYINSAFAASPLLYSGYSGFNALLSGARFMNTGWNLQNLATFFWTSSKHGAIKAWAHGMNDYDHSVSRYPSSRSNAFMVRCIKD